MTLGGTLTVSIAAGGIQDLSAVSNGVQVLGINTVRYATTDGAAAGTTSAKGTLAETGKNIDLYTPLFLLIFGLMLLINSRRKKVIS